MALGLLRQSRVTWCLHGGGPWDRYLGRERDLGGYGGGTMSLLAGEDRHRAKEEGRWEAGSRTRILGDGEVPHITVRRTPFSGQSWG